VRVVAHFMSAQVVVGPLVPGLRGHGPAGSDAQVQRMVMGHTARAERVFECRLQVVVRDEWEQMADHSRELAPFVSFCSSNGGFEERLADVAVVAGDEGGRRVGHGGLRAAGAAG